MTELDVLCIGTVVVDIAALGLPDINDWQEKQRIKQIEMLAGGDAANQSIRLADFGRKVSLCAAIGQDTNGVFIKSVLKDRKVDTQFLAEKADIQTGTALVLTDQAGNRNTFSVKGAHSCLAKTDLPKLNWLHVKAISIGSLFSIPQLEDDGLVEYLADAKERGILVFADLGSDKKKQGLNGILKFLPYIDFFLPSDYDAMKMTNTCKVEDAVEVYRAQEGAYGNIIIKCGEQGCYYSFKKDCENIQRMNDMDDMDKNLSSNNRYCSGWIKAEKIDPVDTTGAGDCMAAMLIDAILMGYDLEDACRYAVKLATLSTKFPGASKIPLPLPEEKLI